MRLELALIVGIIFFCCWCSYIIFKMNSSVPNLSQSQYPLEITTNLPPNYMNNNETLAHFNQQQHAQYMQHQQQQVPQIQQQYQQYLYQPPPQAQTKPQTQSITRYLAAHTNRQPQFATAPYAATQVPWSDPQNLRPLIQQQQQQQPVVHGHMRYQARLPPVDSAVSYFAAPSVGHQYAQTMSSHLAMPQEDPDPDEQQTGGSLGDDGGQSDEEQQADENSVNTQNGNNNKGHNGDDDDETQVSHQDEPEEEGVELEQHPVNSELEEKTGRRSFSEDEEDTNERDKNGILVKEKHRHLINGKPINDRKNGQSRQRRRRDYGNGGSGEDDHNLLREIDFDQLVNEIDASNGNENSNSSNNNEDEDNHDGDDHSGSSSNSGDSGESEDTGDEQQQPEGSEQMQRRSRLAVSLPSDIATRSRKQFPIESRKESLRNLLAPARENNGKRINKQDPKSKDLHKHELRESLTAQQWDDDVTGTTDDNKLTSPANETLGTDFSSKDIDRAIEQQEQAAQTTPLPESIIEFEDLNLLASIGVPSISGEPIGVRKWPIEMIPRERSAGKPLARVLVRSRRQVASWSLLSSLQPPAPLSGETSLGSTRDKSLNTTRNLIDRPTAKQTTSLKSSGDQRDELQNVAHLSDDHIGAEVNDAKSVDDRESDGGAAKATDNSITKVAGENLAGRWLRSPILPVDQLTQMSEKRPKQQQQPPTATTVAEPKGELKRAFSSMGDIDAGGGSEVDTNSGSLAMVHWPSMEVSRSSKELSSGPNSTTPIQAISPLSLLTVESLPVREIVTATEGNENPTFQPSSLNSHFNNHPNGEDPVRGEADMSIEVLARPPTRPPLVQDAFTVSAQQMPSANQPPPAASLAPPLASQPYQLAVDHPSGSFDSTTNPQPDGYAVPPTLAGAGPPAMPEYQAHASKTKRSKKVRGKKKKKKKKKMMMKKSKLDESKRKAAEAHAMKKKSKFKKGYIRAKEAKMKKDKLAKHKSFKGSTKGKKSAKGRAQRGGKKGSVYLKDKGYKKRGFKKAYQKVEAGDHKTYFDEFRDKDHSKKWKHFKDGHDYSHKKHWAGKDKKLYKHLDSDSMKHKKAKSGNWKEKKKSKYSKHFDHKSKKAKRLSEESKKKKKEKVKKY